MAWLLRPADVHLRDDAPERTDALRSLLDLEHEELTSGSLCG